MFIPSISGVSLQIHAVCAASSPAPRQSPGSCCNISHSIADEGGAWKAGWEGESSSRPFCSQVMKERQVVMKERAIPGPCNCCPRGPRIQYYSMGLAVWHS